MLGKSALQVGQVDTLSANALSQSHWSEIKFKKQMMIEIKYNIFGINITIIPGLDRYQSPVQIKHTHEFHLRS